MHSGMLLGKLTCSAMVVGLSIIWTVTDQRSFVVQLLCAVDSGCRTVAQTNTPSNTAFRGFESPQGTVVIEDAINRQQRP